MNYSGGNYSDAEGKRFDTQSGLYYFGSRWYDPGSGRFMNQDSYRGSIDEPMSLHRYAYVHNNPINMIDEWGYAAQFKPQPDFTKQRIIGATMIGMGTALAALTGIDAVANKGVSMWNNATMGVQEEPVDWGFFGFQVNNGKPSVFAGTGSSAVGVSLDGQGNVAVQAGRGSTTSFQPATSVAIAPSQNQPKTPTSDDFGMQAEADGLNGRIDQAGDNRIADLRNSIRLDNQARNAAAERQAAIECLGLR